MGPLRAAALAIPLLAACATGRPATVTLAVRCNVPDASVLVDDVLVGHASQWAPPGHTLRPGFHRIEIRQVGYFSHYTEIDLRDGAATVVQADLHPLLD